MAVKSLEDITVEEVKGMNFLLCQKTMKKIPLEKRQELYKGLNDQYVDLISKSQYYYDAPFGGGSISSVEFNKLMNRVKKIEILMGLCLDLDIKPKKENILREC